MRIGFVVNDIATEEAGYTTTRLAIAAKQRGHEVWLIGVGDLIYNADESIGAHAVTAPGKTYKAGETFLKEVRGDKAVCERISADDLDVLMLRNNPAEDGGRAWAQSAGIVFGDHAARRGTIVVNHPSSLAMAINKMYLQTFPEAVRPRTLVSRSVTDIREFIKQEDGRVVLKPLQGSGGQGVFLAREDDTANINQMVEAIVRDGYCIAQEYLPAASEGDTRLFVMNGEPLQINGKYAAFRRVSAPDDMRSNLHAGGHLARAEINDSMLRLVELVRPKLIQDGMFLVGLDIVGDKLMEINVFSPGGLGSAQKMEDENFTEAVITALERKVRARSDYGDKLDNSTLACL
ncbi:MAG TPA: glutathione synthetase [Armatimonadaceae bacterium]|nr:glutathione synthetase [Armatimonadaceae bacterium]